jgi:ribonuclease HII
MKNAVSSLKIKPEIILVDGNHKIPDLDIRQETIVDGDAKSACIACASILAKVTRDRLMYQYAKEFPQYLFEDHKGYGTKKHIECIKQYGPCEIHRKSFAPVKDFIKLS